MSETDPEPEHPNYDEYEDRYPSEEDIDFSRIHHMFHGLVLFDDMFLNMQGMNIAITDQFITSCEYSLLKEYFQLEKTPMDTAMFVSAQSQMWIFAVYELLRTWRQRIRKLQGWKSAGSIGQMLRNLQQDRHHLGAAIRARHLERMRDDPSLPAILTSHLAAMEGVFRMTEGIRINLAKHEIPSRPNSAVRAPGYGRINQHCGALDFQVDRADNSFEYINRRDIAEALRRVRISDATER